MFFAAAFAFFAAALSVSPVPQSSDPGHWWTKRFNQKKAEIAKGGSRVVFLGDSITHYFELGGSGMGKTVWDRYWAGAPYNALNLGFAADRTEHLLWRIAEGGQLDGYEAKAIVLMIGTNNTGQRNDPPAVTIAGVKKILSAIAEKQPKARIILTAIFPRGADANNGCRQRNDIVNKEIAKFADGKRVIWCDFSDKFLSANGRLSPELFPDLLHPGERGYEIWAGSVVPLIDKVLSARPDESIASVWPSNPQNYSFVRKTPVRPETRFPDQKWWKSRCLEKRNEIVDNGDVEYDIVMVGDSITHRWEREGGEGRALFAELKKTYRILNLGYGGDRTQHVIWRMENGELEGYRAKLFTLMIGTNNTDRNPADVAAGVKRILEIIRAKHPQAKVVLMPIFPRGAKPDDKNRVRNEKTNAIIKEYADGKDVLWLDFNAKFLEPDGTMTKRVMNDLLHPNETGYRIWLDAIGPVFRQVLGK